MHLMAYETRSNHSSETKPPIAFRVCEKLHPHLALLAGNAGFRALLTRALALPHPQVPWLRAVQVKPDGSLTWLGELETQVAPQEIAAGGGVLLAELLGLLVAFIGEKLTLRLVQQAWPELALANFDLGGG